MKQRQHLTAEKKAKILRELLDNQTPLSEVSERYGVNVNDILRWKKQLFERASTILERKNGKVETELERRNKILEERLKKKDMVISQIAQENMELKKNIDGED